MNLTILFSTLSTIILTMTAIALTWRRQKTRLAVSVFIPLLISILLYDFISLSNALEHSGITDFFDPFEDIAEVVFTLTFLFFINNWRKDQSETRFRDLFKLAPVALAEISRDGKVIEVNDTLAKMLDDFYGATIKDIPTVDHWWEIVYPDPEYRKDIKYIWSETLEALDQTGANTDSKEREFTCRDGSKKTIVMNIGSIGDHILLSMIDITDLKKAEAEQEKLQQQLLQAQKMEAIGSLAGGVAHDFNNMLGAIMGFAELTMEETNADESIRENIAKILDAAKRSTSLVRQLLIFSRKQAADPISININNSVETMLKMLRRLIGENIELIWLPSDKNGTVLMDPSQLDQILANLCVNAREAISDIGRITIKTDIVFFDEKNAKSHIDCPPGYYVQLSVMDDGCGMDKETVQHVFEPFFTTKDIGQGTGLGLATVYGIVKQNHGVIDLYSEPGIGTKFDIYIPHHLDRSAADSVQPSVAIPRGQGETILMVEDDQRLMDVSRIMLERMGYDVLTATTPNEAIKLAKVYTGNIHLFLTDVVMPEMNGRQLIDQLSQIRPDAKHIFMSGYTADVIMNRGISEKERYFIQKPFSQKDIAVKIHDVLTEKKMASI